MKKRNSGEWFFFFTVLFFFVFGLSAGAFTEVFLEDGMYYETAGYLKQLFHGEGTGLSSGRVFWSSLKSNGALLALMTAGGVTVIGFPVTLLVLAYKGASLGFTLALLGETMGFQGFLSSAASLLLQNLILIPMFLIFSFLTLFVAAGILSAGRGSGQRGFSQRGWQEKRRAYREGMAFYCLCFLGAGAALLAGCFIEAYFSSPLFHLFS